MKKWVVLAIMTGILAGCNSGVTNETTESGEVTEASSTTELSTAEKKEALKDADFQLEGTAYRIKILDTWEISPEENISFSANDEMETTGVMVYGIKKADISDFDTFKFIMKEQTEFTMDFQLEEGSIQETDYQTAHYPGELYRFTGNSEGIKMEVRYYFLETETEYVVVNYIAMPSFFDKNADLVTEMLDSFVAV